MPVPHPVDACRTRADVTVGVEGQSELIEAAFDSGQRINRLVASFKYGHHVIAVAEVRVDAELPSRVMVERVQGKVGKDLASTGTNGNTFTRAVYPDKQLEDGDSSTALEYPAHLVHQPVLIDTVEKFAYIGLQIVLVPASRQVVRQLFRALMDTATDQAGICMVDQFVLDRDPYRITHSMLHDPVFKVRGVDQAGFCITEREFVMGFGLICAIT